MRLNDMESHFFKLGSVFRYKNMVLNISSKLKSAIFTK